MAGQGVLDADWYDKQRQDGLIATAVTMTGIAGAFVTARCIGRFVLNRNGGMDDYLILGAMAFLVGYTVDCFLMKYVHAGFPMKLLSLDDMISILKITLSIELIYYATIFCVKTSILFSYLRFAITHKFRWICIGTIVLHSVFFIICIGVTLGQCQPLATLWDILGTTGGRCINSTAFFYSTSGFNVVTDIWILLLPIPTLKSIQRPKPEKIALMIIFGVGVFAVICSIIRLHTIYTFTQSTDPTRDALLINIWSLIEVGVAISCASVPGIKSVLTWNRRRTATQTGNNSAGTYNSTQNTWVHKRLNSKDQNSQSTMMDAERGEGQQYVGTKFLAHPQPVELRKQSSAISEAGQASENSHGGSSESMLLFTPPAPRPTGRISEGERTLWLSSDSEQGLGIGLEK